MDSCIICFDALVVMALLLLDILQLQQILVLVQHIREIENETPK